MQAKSLPSTVNMGLSIMFSVGGNKGCVSPLHTLSPPFLRLPHWTSFRYLTIPRFFFWAWAFPVPSSPCSSALPPTHPVLLCLDATSSPKSSSPLAQAWVRLPFHSPCNTALARPGVSGGQRGSILLIIVSPVPHTVLAHSWNSTNVYWKKWVNKSIKRCQMERLKWVNTVGTHSHYSL